MLPIEQEVGILVLPCRQAHALRRMDGRGRRVSARGWRVTDVLAVPRAHWFWSSGKQAGNQMNVLASGGRDGFRRRLLLRV